MDERTYGRTGDRITSLPIKRDKTLEEVTDGQTDSPLKHERTTEHSTEERRTN